MSATHASANHGNYKTVETTVLCHVTLHFFRVYLFINLFLTYEVSVVLMLRLGLGTKTTWLRSGEEVLAQDMFFFGSKHS